MGYLDKIMGQVSGNSGAGSAQKSGETKKKTKKQPIDMTASAEQTSQPQIKRSKVGLRDNTPKPMPGEKKEQRWTYYEPNPDRQMTCTDESGRTQDIKGKVKFGPGWQSYMKYGVNPPEFTITDSSSGQDNVYKYRKVGVDSKGRAIYSCVSKNGQPLEANQYTLEWKDDKTPTLVQHKDQDNYGIGLRTQKGKKSLSTAELPKDVLERLGRNIPKDIKS